MVGLIGRAGSGDTNFTAIGTVADPSFADMSLRPATAYSYKVTVKLNGRWRGRKFAGRDGNHASRTAALRYPRHLCSPWI